MKTDVLFAGVGGQGILSIAALVAQTAMRRGLSVKQSEVHGMAQRGGAVLAHLRISDHSVHSDLIPRASADLVVSLELLEALRYLEYLSRDGALLTATTRVRNIPDYPDAEELTARIAELPCAHLVDAEALAKESGSILASNVVMVGAAAHLLPFGAEEIEKEIRRAFQSKGESIVDANLRAFRAGREAIPCASSSIT